VSEPLFVYRIRATPRSAAAVAPVAAALGVALPESMNTFTGDGRLSCAQVEPRAWLVISEQSLVMPEGTLPMVVDLSDRYARLRVSGADAADTLAAGTGLSPPPVGGCAHTLFAGEFVVFLQRLAGNEYRLLVEAPLAPVLADWLADQAACLLPTAAVGAGSI
jgi:heterotetrameric sarcosine oxidase gamma subunit